MSCLTTCTVFSFLLYVTVHKVSGRAINYKETVRRAELTGRLRGGNKMKKRIVQVDLVADSIREFGFKQPIVVSNNNIIVAGHTRVKDGADW